MQRNRNARANLNDGRARRPRMKESGEWGSPEQKEGEGDGDGDGGGDCDLLEWEVGLDWERGAIIRLLEMLDDGKRGGAE